LENKQKIKIIHHIHAHRWKHTYTRGTYVHKRNVKSVERCTEQKEKEIERAREILNGERKIYVGI